MRVVRLTVVPDADGMLRFAIPAAEAGRFEAEVRLTPVPAADGAPEPPRTIHPSYPPGWEHVYGSIQDETFVRPPDLPLTPVEPLG